MAAEVLSMSIYLFFISFILIFVILTSSKGGESLVEYRDFFSFFVEDPWSIVVFFALTFLLSLLIVLKIRNHRFILGYDFNYETKQLKLLTRLLFGKEAKEVNIDFNDILVIDIKESRSPFSVPYKGVKILSRTVGEKYYFFKRHLLWKGQQEDSDTFFINISSFERVSVSNSL